VTVLAYLAENFCLVAVGDQQFDTNCPDEGDPAGLVPIPDPSEAFGYRQFLGVQCTEGHTGWVRTDDALFAHPQIRNGRIEGYGAVTKAEEGGEQVP
jgi:hypothetical protein